MGGIRAFILITVLISGMLIGFLTFAFVFAGEIYEYQDTVDGVHLPIVDSIVVLAGGRGRIASSGDIWYRYWEMLHHPLPGVTSLGKDPAPKRPPVLYLSGMGHQSTWSVLARHLRRGVLQVIRPEDVVIEKESYNTLANAQWLIRYAKERSWERILLITSPYHMKRAKLIFEKEIQAEGYPLAVETLSIYQEPFEPGEWRNDLHGIRVTMTEYLKYVYYRAFWKPTPVSQQLLTPRSG